MGDDWFVSTNWEDGVQEGGGGTYKAFARKTMPKHLQLFINILN
jgi:hypothetical protein